MSEPTCGAEQVTVKPTVCAQQQDTHQLISVRFAEGKKKKTKESEVGTSRQPPSSAGTKRRECGASGGPSGATHYTASLQLTPLDPRHTGLLCADATRTADHFTVRSSQQQQGGASSSTRVARRVQEKKGSGFQSKSRTAVAKEREERKKVKQQENPNWILLTYNQKTACGKIIPAYNHDIRLNKWINTDNREYIIKS